MVNFSAFALSHVSKHVSCARTYLKYVRASESSLSGFFLLQDVADDETSTIFPMLRKPAGRLGEVLPCERSENFGGGVGVFLLLHCTAWWRVIYLLCLVVSRLKGVLVI